MNKFSFGAITGAMTLAIAVPLFAQISSAASSATATDKTTAVTRPIPSQECVAAMATVQDAELANFDTMSATRKEQLQSRITALKAAAAITDAAARQAALQALRQQKPTDMTPPAALTTAMEAAKTACGDTFFMGFGGPGGHGKHMMKFNLAEKFGMTETELKAALDSGKTIEEIATEKGVTLPAKGPRGGHMKWSATSTTTTDTRK